MVPRAGKMPSGLTNVVGKLGRSSLSVVSWDKEGCPSYNNDGRPVGGPCTTEGPPYSFSLCSLSIQLGFVLQTRDHKQRLFIPNHLHCMEGSNGYC
jgi:hypothetical protein